MIMALEILPNFSMMFQSPAWHLDVLIFIIYNDKRFSVLEQDLFRNEEELVEDEQDEVNGQKKTLGNLCIPILLNIHIFKLSTQSKT